MIADRYEASKCANDRRPSTATPWLGASCSAVARSRGPDRHPVAFDADTITVTAKLPIRIIWPHAIGALAAQDPVLVCDAAEPLSVGRLRIPAIVTRLCH